MEKRFDLFLESESSKRDLSKTNLSEIPLGVFILNIQILPMYEAKDSAYNIINRWLRTVAERN